MNEKWIVHVEAQSLRPLNIDDAAEILDRFVDLHGVVSGGDGSTALTLTFDVEGEFVGDGIEAAMLELRQRAPELSPVGLEIQTVADQERELSEPNGPDLVGVGELAEELKVTKQRASEIARREDFPAPLARLKSGPVWRRSSVDRFIAGWPRKVGRPRTKA